MYSYPADSEAFPPKITPFGGRGTYRPSGAGTITAFGSTLGIPKCPLR